MISIPYESFYASGRVGGIICLLFLYLNGFTERLQTLKKGFSPSEKTLSPLRRVWCSEENGCIDFNQAWLNSRDGLSGPSFSCSFHLHFPSPALSACFLSEISPMWRLMCHWNPADSCQPLHLEAKCRDGKQQASFPADKNTNMNCYYYYYYPISRLSSVLRIFSHLAPHGLSIEKPRACKSVCLYTSHQEQILMLNFLAVGHPIMHLSSANSNVTLTLGRGVSWNIMNNLIKLHSESKRGIIRLVVWCLAARKGPARLRHPARHHAWN